MFRLASALVLSALLATTAWAADTFNIDKEHSTAIFKAKHLNLGYTYGRFNDVSGTFTAEGGKPTSVSLVIKADSVDSFQAKRDEHLRGPDFFNAKQFPTITFTSTAITPNSDGSYNVAGKLNMHGVEKPITIKVSKVGEGADPWGGFRSGYEATITVKRSDFGMNQMLNAVSDEITMIVAVEGIKK